MLSYPRGQMTQFIFHLFNAKTTTRSFIQNKREKTIEFCSRKKKIISEISDTKFKIKVFLKKIPEYGHLA